MPRFAERVGQASGSQVAQIILDDKELDALIAVWTSVGEKVDKILGPFAEIVDSKDTAGEYVPKAVIALIRAIVVAKRL